MKSYRFGLEWGRNVCLAVLAVAALAWLGNGAQAQPAAPAAAADETDAAVYADSWPTDEGLRKESTNVQNILRNGLESKDQGPTLDKYFTNYSIARWTQKKNQALLTKFRKELRNDLLLARPDPAQGKTADAHNRLLRLAFEQMKKMAGQNFPPVVRVNAMLMIGELNAEEAFRPSEKQVPLPDALGVLVESAQNAGFPEPVRIAAMVGLQRRAEIDALKEADARKQVTQAALKILDGSIASKPSTPVGSEWLRAQAADILGRLADPGENGSVVTALAKVAGSSGLSVTTRCAAARALGHIKYAKGSGPDAISLAQAIEKMLTSACTAARAAFDEGSKQPALVAKHLQIAVAAAQTAVQGTDTSHPGIIGAAKDAAQQQAIKTMGENLTKLAAITASPPAAPPPGGNEDYMKQIDAIMSELLPKADKGP